MEHGAMGCYIHLLCEAYQHTKADRPSCQCDNNSATGRNDQDHADTEADEYAGVRGNKSRGKRREKR